MQQPSIPSSPDVLVVGAGVAGLFCAAGLADAGLRVAVLEARAHPGGRARSWHEDALGMEVDIGPHVVSSEHVNFMRMLRRLGTEGQVAMRRPGCGDWASPNARWTGSGARRCWPC